MRTNKIANIDQLQAEIRRLKSVEAEQLAAIKKDVRDVRESLRPENILVNALSSMTGIKINKSEFLKNGIAMGLSLVLQRFVFKTETSIEKKVYGWLDKLFDQVKYYTNKYSSAGSVRSEKIEEN